MTVHDRLALSVLAAALLLPSAGRAADEEGCLDCHGHRGLSARTEDGRVISHFLEPPGFFASAHGMIRCTECHRDVQRIPHGEVRVPECTGTCHVQEPSTGLLFSHAPLAEHFERSVHGVHGRSGDAPVAPDDLPTCTTCHRNDPVGPVFDFRTMREGAAQEVLSRCLDCHQREAFARRFYAHFSHRFGRRLRPVELVRLCTGCHEDEARMARHGLEVTNTLRDTYHWKLVLLGDPNAPDCLSCHVPVGFSAHDIRHKGDARAATHADNRVSTCANLGGIQRCHPKATPDFASGRIPSSGAKAEAYGRLDHRLGGQRLETALEAAAAREITSDVAREEVLLDLVRDLYKILIALVAGLMLLHQALDAVRRLAGRLAAGHRGDPS